MKTLWSGLVLALAAGFWLAAPAAPAGEIAYVGSNKCKPCHFREWKSWSATKMAKAYDSLKPGEATEAKSKAGLDPNEDFTKNPSCLRCHTTGYGQPGGFVDIESTPDRAGIGCEMCHGPGGTYTKEGYMTLKNKEYKKAELVKVGLVGEVGAEQCTVCHNKDNPFAGPDYKFDFATEKTKGVHEHFPLRYPH